MAELLSTALPFLYKEERLRVDLGEVSPTSFFVFSGFMQAKALLGDFLDAKIVDQQPALVTAEPRVSSKEQVMFQSLPRHHI